MQFARGKLRPLLPSRTRSGAAATSCGLTGRKHRVISGAIIGEAYHTKIDEVLKCLERAAKNREVVEFTSHGISPDAKGINMKTEWLEAILAKAQVLGLEVLSFDELDRPFK